MRHEPSGLLILPAPLEPAFADQISAAEMVQIVELLRTFCSYVVIDTPAYFNDVVLGLIEVSDDVLLVAGHGHPEHQEREDRPADAAPAQHADDASSTSSSTGRTRR